MNAVKRRRINRAMTEKPPQKGTRTGDAKAKSDDKAARLAAALRDNLRRRKDQARGQAGTKETKT